MSVGRFGAFFVRLAMASPLVLGLAAGAGQIQVQPVQPRPFDRAGTVSWNIDTTFQYPGTAGYGAGVFLTVQSLDYLNVTFPASVTLRFEVSTLPAGLSLQYNFQPDSAASGCPVGAMKVGGNCYPMNIETLPSEVVKTLTRENLVENGNRWRVILFAETGSAIPPGPYRIRGRVTASQMRLVEKRNPAAAVKEL